MLRHFEEPDFEPETSDGLLFPTFGLFMRRLTTLLAVTGLLLTGTAMAPQPAVPTPHPHAAVSTAASTAEPPAGYPKPSRAVHAVVRAIPPRTAWHVLSSKHPLPKPVKLHHVPKPKPVHRSKPKPPPVHVRSSGSPRAYAQSLMSAAQFQCFDNIAERESGWNVYATNPSSGAYGIAQALPGSKMASAGTDWRTNGDTQVRWMLGYVKSRYGSPCSALTFRNGHGWY